MFKTRGTALVIGNLFGYVFNIHNYGFVSNHVLSDNVYSVTDTFYKFCCTRTAENTEFAERRIFLLRIFVSSVNIDLLDIFCPTSFHSRNHK